MDIRDQNKKIKLQLIFIGTGCAVNLALFFIKLYIGLSTNSISVYADSLNNGLDSIGCIAALAGTGLLAKKKSAAYPYGFGRAQNLTDFLLSVGVIVTGFYFGYISLERLMYPVPLWFSVKYALLLAVTAAVKIMLGVFFRIANKKVASGTLKAMSYDSFLDFFITLSTIISMTLSEKSGYSIDGVIGILIAVVLAAQGVKLLTEAGCNILGKKDGNRCSAALKIIEEEGLTAKRVNCHLYGEKTVFTADVLPDKDFEKKSGNIKTKIQNEMQAEIFFRFGGVIDE
ncbi:MAG: cation diffusion facilitator family transporter [Clostridia bacterium]|nr:cation diffusion facilitator family transporter [Clostridia bacterium]